MSLTEISRIILAALAVYRLAFMLREDDGPLFIFRRLRAFTDRKRKEEQECGQEAGLWAGLDEGIRCPYCCGVWAAALCAVLVLWPTPPGDVFLLWLGLAGAQSLLESRSDR